jgi:hypothetical protein
MASMILNVLMRATYDLVAFSVVTRRVVAGVVGRPGGTGDAGVS